MSELDDDLYTKVLELSRSGDKYCELSYFISAIEEYEKALEIIPRPKVDWEASTWLYIAIGDACFLADIFEKGKHALYDALNCPDGHGNPFIYLRLGQCLFELKELEKAAEFLLRAYMLEGLEIFDHEDRKYLESLKTKYEL